MGAVALDADVLIGFLEPTDAQHDRAVELLASPLKPGHRLYIGASVYAEALVRPLQLGRPEVVEGFLSAARVEIVPVDESVARVAAGLRAEHRSLRAPALPRTSHPGPRCHCALSCVAWSSWPPPARLPVSPPRRHAAVAFPTPSRSPARSRMEPRC